MKQAVLLGNQDFQKVADKAQFDSLVLLENKDKILPLKSSSKVYLYGFAEDAKNTLKGKITIVDKLDQADVVVARVNAPYEQKHKNYFFGARYHEGSLEYTADDKDIKFINEASKKYPVVVTVYLDRPAVLTPVKQIANAVVANFGVNDDVLFKRLLDSKPFSAKLPFALPDSMDSVIKQSSDLANDMQALYPLGYGLTL